MQPSKWTVGATKANKSMQSNNKPANSTKWGVGIKSNVKKWTIGKPNDK
jgi:hypothetical protein